MSRLAQVVCLGVVLSTVAARPSLAQDVSLVQPVQRTLSAVLVSGTSHHSASLTVPRGKRLVIEYVSARIVPSTPTSALVVNDVAIATTVQNVTAKHSLFSTRP